MINKMASTALLDSGWQDGAYYDHAHRLRLTYYHPPLPPRGILRSTDWFCPNADCKTLNLARRSNCFSCQAPRTAEVECIDPSVPTNVLKINNLGPEVTEEELEYMIKPYVGVTFVRVVVDKGGMPLGFGWAHFRSVEDAKVAKEALDGMQVAGTKLKLRVRFGRDVKERGSVGGGSAKKGGEQQQEQQQVEEEEEEEGRAVEEGVGDVGKDIHQGKKRKKKNKKKKSVGGGDDVDDTSIAVGWEPKAFDDVDDNDDNNNESDVSKQKKESHVLEYDAASGYMVEVATGLFLDSNTGYYFDPIQQVWGTKDPNNPRTVIPYTTATTAAAAAATPPTPTATKKKDGITNNQIERNVVGAVVAAAPQVDAAALEQRARLLLLLQEEEEVAAKEEKEMGAPVKGVLHKGKWANRRISTSTN